MKLIGGIFLVMGTCIGAGMLALPIISSVSGFITAFALLVGCWLIMLFSAFLMLEASLWMPLNSNIISMSRCTLGKGGELLAWIVYLLLLYSINSAYLSSGTDIIYGLFGCANLTVPSWICTVLFVAIFGFVVFRGIRSVDYVNRFLMLFKIAILLTLIVLISKHINISKLVIGRHQIVTSSVTVMITAFAFSTIIPTLRTYLDNNAKQLRLCIFLGSLIPLFLYILWELVILGSIPLTGDNSLAAMQRSNHAITDLILALNIFTKSSVITICARIFINICVLTSFLGVSLCFMDFLKDSFALYRIKHSRLDLAVFTFFPPIVIVLFYPGAFIKALNYAGMLCIVLEIILPALMVWNGRYRNKLAGTYQTKGGKAAVGGVLVLGLSIILLNILKVNMI